ncbi:hypothetical protein D7D52_21975 [Nocardia yunnanensis]|uniref:Uncharacterized protein n=1 Tax=Nocardia yunnanensis TaxID=2382165 RepID=A0A386ZDW2_9NOCA|nr:hypothetical protein [Nocardia yunnanensis]AYF76062.1 hypothetical protein D7D52_21975 [Nocardia yunnanensis]
MAGRRRGWFRTSGTARNNEWVQQARQVLTTAFLDMDRRQSIAEAAVVASAALFPERGMAARWEAVRARCYGASGAYLALNDRLDQAERDGTAIAQPEIDGVVRGLSEAARGVDDFYRGNQAHLEHAVAVYGSVPQLAGQVRAQAQAQRAAAAASPFADYPSVRQCAAALDEGLVTLDAAVVADPRATREAATRLETLTRELSSALEAAPGKQHSATTAIASAATRLEAARNRLERVAPALSALLREFAAASSNDLANNERQAREAVAAADADLTRARAALANSDPEDALDLTSTARAHLATAEERADAVTARLALLRQVREQPTERAKAVRFKLRDAQMLAVNKGVVPQWGSVLDAQSDRLDRAAAALTGRHPDYWAYVSELDAISAFVAGVVDRMRNTDR